MQITTVAMLSTGELQNIGQQIDLLLFADKIKILLDRLNWKGCKSAKFREDGELPSTGAVAAEQDASRAEHHWGLSTGAVSGCTCWAMAMYRIDMLISPAKRRLLAISTNIFISATAMPFMSA